MVGKVYVSYPDPERSLEDREHPLVFRYGRLDGIQVKPLPRHEPFLISHQKQVRIGRLRLGGYSIAAIAREVGVNRKTVARLLWRLMLSPGYKIAKGRCVQGHEMQCMPCGRNKCSICQARRWKLYAQRARERRRLSEG